MMWGTIGKEQHLGDVPYTDAISSSPSSALGSVPLYSIGLALQSFLATILFFSSGAGTQDLVHAGQVLCY